MAIDFSGTAKAPPRKRTSGTKIELPPPGPSLKEKRTDGLNDLGQLGQGACMILGQWADAAAIGMHWEGISTALADVAEEYDVVAAPIDFLIKVGPLSAVALAVLPLALQIGANHRLLDAEKMVGQNVIPPEILEAQMRAQVAKAHTQALREREIAMREAQEAQNEYERMLAEQQEAQNGNRPIQVVDAT